MKRLFWAVFAVFVIFGSLEARNNTCYSSYLIPDLNNITEPKTFNETNGKLSLTDLDDYFHFTPKVNGKLTIEFSADRNVAFYARTGDCGLDPALLTGLKSLSTKSYTGIIEVKKNKAVRIRISKLALGTVEYKLKLTFDVDGFYEDFNENLYGDITVIGNSVLQEKKETKNKWGQVTKVEAVCPSNDSNNNDLITWFENKIMFANIDNQPLNSTSAKLTIPDGATVKYAKLYWQGISEGVSGVDKIKLKAPGESSYRTITSDQIYKIESNRFYQGAAIVTEYVKNGGSGDYFVADLQTNINPPGNTGPFGAWALVVVYDFGEDATKAYKNIAVYDGFQIVQNTTAHKKRSYKLSGFLTPTKTDDFNSTFILFAGEGDVSITGDQAGLTSGSSTNPTWLKDSIRSENNLFNSRITRNGSLVTDRNPNCTNTVGIDIAQFDIGYSGQKIMKKAQTETTVTLTSSQDAYFPGMFAFATDLYKPDVCYANLKVFEIKTKKDENGNVISTTKEQLTHKGHVDINSTILVEADIANKSVGEDAFKVRLSHKFGEDSPYHNNSLKIDGGSKTDAEDGDFAFFNEATNRVFFSLGRDTLGDKTDKIGGTIAKGRSELYRVSYKRDFNASDIVTLKYQIDYSQGKDTDLIEGIDIFECDGAPSFMLGIGLDGLKIYDDYEANKETKKLYTKVVGQKDSKYKVYFDAKDYNLTAKDPMVTIYFDKTLVKQEKMSVVTGDSFSFKISEFTKAEKAARFSYEIEEGIDLLGNPIPEIPGNTTESFAIRPAKFDISKSELLGLVGHEVEIEVIKAVSLSGNSAPNYNTTLNFNSSFNETTLNSNNCAVTQFGGEDSIVYKYEESILSKGQVIFANGAGSFEKGKIAFSDVGKFELILRDKDWASLDAYEQACIQGSDENTPDDDGKIGCDIAGSIDVEIVPNELAISFTDQRSWSYMADQPDFGDRNLSHMHLTGVVEGYKIVDGKELAKNLHGGCYEPSVTVSLTSNNEKWKIDHEIGDGLEHNGGKDNSETYLYHLWKNSGITHEKGQFENGEAYFSVFANVNRTSPKLVKNPESLKLDLELKSELEGKGTNLTKKIASHDHTFYYGKFYAPRNITSYVNSAKIDYQVEIYCPAGGCMGNKPAMLNKWVIADQDSLTKITSKEKGEEGKKIEFASGVFSWGDAPVKQHDDKTIVYHHSIPSYLWYGAYVKDYEFDSLEKTDCLSHPCTEVKFQGDQDEWGGTAGDQEKNRIKAEDKSGATQDIRPRINW